MITAIAGMASFTRLIPVMSPWLAMIAPMPIIRASAGDSTKNTDAIIHCT